LGAVHPKSTRSARIRVDHHPVSINLRSGTTADHTDTEQLGRNSMPSLDLSTFVLSGQALQPTYAAGSDHMCSYSRPHSVKEGSRDAQQAP
jgi:hypothetical protein